jgi:chorismate mutase/prephenate dehydratase
MSRNFEAEIAALRKQIDTIDAQLVELINQRADLAQKIGRIKKAHDKPALVPEREQQVLEHVQAINKGPLSSEAIRDIFLHIVDESRKLEK